MKYMKIAYTAAILGAACMTQPAAAQPVELSTTAQPIAAEYATAERVTIPIYASSRSAAGVFGVELAITATSGDIAIREVTFDPAFGNSVGEVSPAVAAAGNAGAQSSAAASTDGAPLPTESAGTDSGASNATAGSTFRAVRSQAAATEPLNYPSNTLCVRRASA